MMNIKDINMSMESLNQREINSKDFVVDLD